MPSLRCIAEAGGRGRQRGSRAHRAAAAPPRQVLRQAEPVRGLCGAAARGERREAAGLGGVRGASRRAAKVQGRQAAEAGVQAAAADRGQGSGEAR